MPTSLPLRPYQNHPWYTLHSPGFGALDTKCLQPPKYMDWLQIKFAKNDGHNNREAQAPSAKQFDEYRNMDKVWNNDVGLHVAIRVPV